MIPASLSPLERSPGLNLIARMATKIGTDAFAIAATPESMCFSPQAISVNGSAPLIVPKIRPSRQVLRTPASAGRTPSRTARKVSSSSPPISSRISMKKLGEKSRTPTLMKRYEAPQIPARKNRSGP